MNILIFPGTIIPFVQTEYDINKEKGIVLFSQLTLPLITSEISIFYSFKIDEKSEIPFSNSIRRRYGFDNSLSHFGRGHSGKRKPKALPS